MGEIDNNLKDPANWSISCYDADNSVKISGDAITTVKTNFADSIATSATVDSDKNTLTITSSDGSSITTALGDLISTTTTDWIPATQGTTSIGYYDTYTPKYYSTGELDFETDNNVLKDNKVADEEVFLDLDNELKSKDIIGWTLISRRSQGSYKNKRFKYGFKTRKSAWIVEFGIFVEGNLDEILIYASPNFTEDFTEEVEEAIDKILKSRVSEQPSKLEEDYKKLMEGAIDSTISTTTNNIIYTLPNAATTTNLTLPVGSVVYDKSNNSIGIVSSDSKITTYATC